MNRRGFLGTLAAAITAGPKVAATAIKEIPNGLPLDPGWIGLEGFGSHDGPTTGEVSRTITRATPWRLIEIGKLKSFLSGDRNREQKEEELRHRLHHRLTMTSQNIAQLHSVSGVHKVAMHTRAALAYNTRIQKSYANGMLDRFLREHKEREQ